MSQVKGQVIRQRQDRKCPWAAILITKISVADNRLGISSQWFSHRGMSYTSMGSAVRKRGNLPVCDKMADPLIHSSIMYTRQVTRAPRLSLSRNTIMNFQTGKRYKTIRHC